MKKRTLPIWLLGLFFVPATMQAQQFKSEYIKWWPGSSEKPFPELVRDWSKQSPQVTEDDNFFISRVKPKARFRNQATQVKRDLTEANDKRLVAWLPFNDPGVNALPNGVYDSEVFSMWQYVTHWGNWNCPLGRIPAGLLDVAHKNGVPVSSVAGIPHPSFAGNTFWENYLRGFNGLDGTKAAEFMCYFGYDGLGYNSEYNDYSLGVTPHIRNLHKTLMSYMKDRNPIFENMWYDGTNDNGRIAFDRGLDIHNDENFGHAGQEAASLFLNYNWTYSGLLERSVNKAREIGRDPLYLYAGINMQGGQPSGTNWSHLSQYPISIGLWGAHSRNMFFEGRGELGSSSDAKQRTYMLKTEQWFTGGTRNPAKLPPMNNSLNHSATNKTFPGMSAMMSARSSLKWDLTDEPFITYFNLGNGKFFNWKGVRQHNKEWYNVGVQDYLPTWRWWFSSTLMGSEVLTNGLQAEFIWDDAYMGGSCFRVYGTVANEYLQLFKTEYVLQTGDVITVRYKHVNGTGKANLVLTAKDAETVIINEENHNLLTTDQQPDDEVWVAKTFTVDEQLAGKTLALIGLHFTEANNMNLYFGEVSIVRGTAATPSAPTITNQQLYTYSNHGMDGKLIWNMANDKAVGEPCYNTDVKTSVFKVYAQQEGGNEQLMGITTSWAGMLYSIPVDNTLASSKVRLGVQAVSLDFKSESAITWTTDYLDAPTYAYNDNIEISQQVLKANEPFTLKYVDERHNAGTWEIVDVNNTVVKRAENVKVFDVTDGLSAEGNYTVRVIGDVVGSDGTTSVQTREFAGFVQVTSGTIGAVPKINSLTANNAEQNISVEANSPINLAYTGRQADGSLSRGVNMKEMGMTFRAGDAGISTAAREMSFSFWVKYNSIAAGNMQFFDIRDQGTKWPQNNWGVLWATYDPAAKELWFTIRQTNDGGDEHTQIWDLDLRTGVWYHFTIVFEQQGSGVRERIYVNGKEANPNRWKFGNSRQGSGYIPYYQTASASWANSYVMFGFGRHQCSAWDAVIDDVKFYNRKLTAEEVKTAMNTSNTSDNVAAFWNFETDTDEQFNFASQGSGVGYLTSINMRRVTKVALSGEGQGEFFARPAEYEAGCPFVAGSAFSVTTAPEWRTRKAVVNAVEGGNSEAGQATVSYGTAGQYNVTLTLKNSHGSDSRTFSVITVGETTGIAGTEASELQTYTVDKNIFVEFAQEGKYTVEVYNLQGGKVAGNTAQMVAGSQMNVYVGVAGVYILKVVKDGKVVRTAKLLCK